MYFGLHMLKRIDPTSMPTARTVTGQVTEVTILLRHIKHLAMLSRG